MLLVKGLHRDYDRLVGYLRRISHRLAVLATLESFLQLAAGFLLILLGTIFALEWGEALPYFPFIYCLLAILFLSVLLFRSIRRVAFPPSRRVVARALENRFPHLRDDLTNSLLLFEQAEKGRPGQISDSLLAAQVRKTAAELEEMSPGEVVNLRRPLRHLKIVIPLVLALMAVLFWDPQFLNRSLALIANPLATLPVRETSVSVEPAGAILARGKPLAIQAKVTGHRPERLHLVVWPESGHEMRLNMIPEGEKQFSYRVDSAQFSFRYQVTHSRGESPIYQVRVVDPPEVGDVRLTLIPPDYTGLPREVREGGHIDALKGTVVNLEAHSTKTVKEGRITLNQGNQLPLEVEENRLKGSLLVFYPDGYSIRVRDELGFENPNPVQYQIRLIPDRYPEGEILRPAQDMEISGQEMIPIVYQAKDDFGLQNIRISYEVGGKERQIQLKVPSGARAVGPETYRWDLAAVPLAAGDRIEYRLEVEDNDSVSGPKVSFSRSYRFFVRDERVQAAKEGEEAQEISNALLDLLADNLETQRDEESLSKRMEEILKKVDRNLDRMSTRPERFSLEALRRNLASLKENLPREKPEAVTQELERMALLAEDLAKRAKMNEVEALARDMRNRQKRLLESLNDLKGKPTDKELDALMKELDKLEELIRSVMDAMSKLAGGLPDDFINSPDLQGLNFQDMFSDLKEIRERLRAGDLSAALEAAQRLLQSLSQMMAAMGRAGSQANMQSMNRVQGEMSRQAGELDKILAEQQEILKETEKIDRELQRLMEEETARRSQLSGPQEKNVLEQLRSLLSPEQWGEFEELARFLQKENSEETSRPAEGGEKGSGEKRDERLESLRKKMETFTAGQRSAMTPAEKEKFPDLALRQEKLQERTRTLQEKLEMLYQLFPEMDREILQDLQGATGSMGEASGKLRGEDAPGAIPPEQEVLRRLSKSQQAMQQMAQQMAGRMQAARWGYWGWDPRPGWYYGPWIPMPTLPQPQVSRPIERGYTGVDREEFNPPGKDAYRVPPMFREKVMEGLKEETPAEYKGKVEKYFKGLTE